jgi:hypothetical protein
LPTVALRVGLSFDGEDGVGVETPTGNGQQELAHESNCHDRSPLPTFRVKSKPVRTAFALLYRVGLLKGAGERKHLQKG